MTGPLQPKLNETEFAHLLHHFFCSMQSEARRVVHGRGRRYPGLEHLNVDWYPPVLLISAYGPVNELDWLVESAINADDHNQIKGVMVQRRDQPGSPSDIVHGQSAESFVVREGELRYEVHPGRRQNAGLFMDMRLVRDWLTRNCENKNVLNLFAYTCSLSVAALAGGARRVTSVDVSKTSMAWGKRNHELNQQDTRLIKMIPHNIFTSWGRIKQYGRYDLVLIDPPTRQRGSFDAERDYQTVVKRLHSLCNPGAEVIACLNSPFLGWEFLEQLFARHCAGSSLIERMPVAPEYVDVEPARGLKICRFRLA
ncbi:MAG: class I SAM-dependent methyltransferase [Pseudomonadales bacterium]|nr:class I SAM-dependent methyltransferase [Pseudomonadales bacterium]